MLLPQLHTRGGVPATRGRTSASEKSRPCRAARAGVSAGRAPLPLSLPSPGHTRLIGTRQLPGVRSSPAAHRRDAQRVPPAERHPNRLAAHAALAAQLTVGVVTPCPHRAVHVEGEGVLISRGDLGAQVGQLRLSRLAGDLWPAPSPLAAAVAAPGQHLPPGATATVG